MRCHLFADIIFAAAGLMFVILGVASDNLTLTTGAGFFALFWQRELHRDFERYRSQP